MQIDPDMVRDLLAQARKRGATAGDVYRLVAEVRRRVLAASGVDLTPEIRFAGEFE